MTTDSGHACREPDLDLELVHAATRVAETACHGELHTVAAAARTRDGRIVTGVNAFHFTGGPCAELVVIGAAVAQGVRELTAMVAVADRGRGVIPPCGRCRQVLLDYYPELTVIINTGGWLRCVPVRELLPEAYVWADQV
ncbi:cytidine deaminase family protein [Kitasatospora sp. NPDC052896]|uniref:cytidine deaminase family protein n=1 Tax=Kitasatospora sp. NPDC052896 TaxID=3364061 RepID=UPI0037C63945